MYYILLYKVRMGFVTKLTRQVPLVEQELLTPPDFIPGL
jgi:hypothetical protein